MIVCLFLGLPRNLTTLTAGMLALHPNVQVMNHGFKRIDKAGGLRAFAEPTEKNIAALSDLLVDLSKGGQRGNHGGSILLSHAFQKPEMQAAYRERFGDSEIKHDIRAVAWKDSWALHRHLSERQVDAPALTRSWDAVRFISPVRNPYDQIRSLQVFYGGVDPQQAPPGYLADLSLEGVAKVVFDCHLGFLEAWRARPNHFLYYLEKQMGADTLFRLARFLGLEPDAVWLQQGTRLFRSSSHYVDRPEECSQLSRFLESTYGHSPWFVEIMREALAR